MFKSILLFIMIFLIVASVKAENLTSNTKDNFVLLYHVDYWGMPDLKKFGFVDSHIAYEQRFYDHGENRKNDIRPEKLDAVVTEIRRDVVPNSYVQIDIEAWHSKDPILKRVYRDRYFKTMKYLSENLPNYKLGYYRITPAWAHWNLHKSDTLKRDWELENVRRQSIADVSSVLYPSLYTYHSKPEEWEEVAFSLIEQARKLAKGKQVIPFLWPYFHPSSDVKGDGKIRISKAFWRKQLDFAYQHADGLIIWHEGAKEQWSEDLPWWQATVEFLRDNKISSVEGH